MISKFKSNGFSLIEILITVLILAGATIALTKFQAIQMQGTSDARNRNEAMNLAQGRLDQYREEFQTGNISDKAATEIAGKSTTFSVSGNVTNLSIVTGETVPAPSASPAAAPVPKQVVSKVSWSNSQGQTQEVVLATILRYNAQSFTQPIAATPIPTATPAPTATPVPTAIPATPWDSTKNYKKGDYVTFEGDTYVALYDISSTTYTPPTYNYWKKV